MMNTIATFLVNNWERLALTRFGEPSHLSCILATPRFRASRHVVFLIFANRSQDRDPGGENPPAEG